MCIYLSKLNFNAKLTTYNEDTMKILEVKHMYRSPPSMLTTMFSEAPLVAEVYIIIR